MLDNVLLKISDLEVCLEKIPLINSLTLDIKFGEMFGLVGESGSGKSLTALSILRIQEPTMQISNGSIEFNGTNLLNLKIEELQNIRGNEISMIFQEPMTSLNPVFTVGQQIREILLLHRVLSKKQAQCEVLHLLERVGIPLPEVVQYRYPHQLSGGQRQRIMIAIALACKPKLLIADEPTTALDVTIQRQILSLIDKLRKEEKMSVLLITHDLGVVAEYCDRVGVIYGGKIVEVASANDLFLSPKHQYTKALIKAIPSNNKKGKRLSTIDGVVPDPKNRPDGCCFHNRCSAAVEKCTQETPRMTKETHQFACWNPAT